MARKEGGDEGISLVYHICARTADRSNTHVIEKIGDRAIMVDLAESGNSNEKVGRGSGNCNHLRFLLNEQRGMQTDRHWNYSG